MDFESFQIWGMISARLCYGVRNGDPEWSCDGEWVVWV
jgi:hypothetical protein